MSNMDLPDEMLAALGKVLEGYADLLAVARDLANRAADGGTLSPDDFDLHMRKFDTVDAQLSYLRALLRRGPVAGISS
ncbi:hypothetical protein HY634_04325 [Candidatus Uhrbacteria bacterium]|nr:hypothetical protein [Candidatus Uhrbacteria bacterium]